MAKLHLVNWSKMPPPEDDGATCYPAGRSVPSNVLTGTDGSEIDLAGQAGTTAVYTYPMATAMLQISPPVTAGGI
jgi:hypothetical protein